MWRPGGAAATLSHSARAVGCMLEIYGVFRSNPNFLPGLWGPLADLTTPEP